MTATVELDRGELACSGCGRAVPSALVADRIITHWMPTHDRPAAASPVARCGLCAALDVTARRFLGPDAEEPSLARLSRALGCFRLLGRPLPDPATRTAEEILRWFGGWDPTWASALSWQSVPAGHAAAGPWAHVGPEMRRVLAEQFRRWMFTRAHPGRAVPIPPPEGRGCLLCGVDAVSVPAGRAHQIAPDALWRPVAASRGSLGGKGGQRVRGALCGACVDAASDGGGGLVLGPTTMETALARRWESTGEADAAALLSQGLVEGVRAWAVTGLPPSREPWGHMEIPELDGAR